MSPRWGLDTKTDWLIDRQSQCDFDFDLAVSGTLFIKGRRKTGEKTKVLTLNKYMAMGPSGARCQE
jgi:hypothetical protein